MTGWMPDLTGRRGPTYLSIADALADDIQAGRLATGTRLPTHRELADALRVTVGTVTRAYGEAQRRNLISGEVGRGTFVGRAAGGPGRSEGLFGRVAPMEPGLIDLSLNRAIQGLTGSDLADALRSLAEAEDLDTLLDYQPDPGAPTHRAAAAAWLNGRGLTASPEHVVLTTGAQSAITAVLSCLTHPQDIVLTEALTYPGVKSAARLLHLRLEGLALDEQGIVPAALERALRTTEARVLYAIPTLQNPTTRVMPLERRSAVVELCRRYDVTLIEDSVYSFLVEDAPPPLVRGRYRLAAGDRPTRGGPPPAATGAAPARSTPLLRPSSRSDDLAAPAGALAHGRFRLRGAQPRRCRDARLGLRRGARAHCRRRAGLPGQHPGGAANPGARDSGRSAAPTARGGVAGRLISGCGVPGISTALRFGSGSPGQEAAPECVSASGRGIAAARSGGRTPGSNTVISLTVSRSGVKFARNPGRMRRAGGSALKDHPESGMGLAGEPAGSSMAGC